MSDLIVTDTHLGIYADSEVWHSVLIDLFNEISDYCIKNNIKRIFHLGDFFHNRKSLNTRSQEITHQIADILSDFEVYIVVGNHDTYFKNKIKPNTLKIFRKYKNIKIIEENTLIDNIEFVPWGNLPSNMSEAEYCFGHFSINGFIMNESNTECTKGIDVSNFKSYKKVLSGHFHAPSRKDNIIYLGAPYQHTFNDVNGVRGYYTFNNGELEFIEYKKYPHFLRVDDKEVVKMSKKEIEGNIVELKFLEDYGTTKNEKILNYVNERNPLKLNTDFSKVKFIDDEQLDLSVSIINHKEIVKKCIEKMVFPQEIKKDVLYNVIISIIKNIKEE